MPFYWKIRHFGPVASVRPDRLLLLLFVLCALTSLKTPSMIPLSQYLHCCRVCPPDWAACLQRRDSNNILDFPVCVAASSAGGATTAAAHHSNLALEPADIAVIAVYFITVIVVGIWVRPGSLLSTWSTSFNTVSQQQMPLGTFLFVPHCTINVDIAHGIVREAVFLIIIDTWRKILVCLSTSVS